MVGEIVPLPVNLTLNVRKTASQDKGFATTGGRLRHRPDAPGRMDVIGMRLTMRLDIKIDSVEGIEKALPVGCYRCAATDMLCTLRRKGSQALRSPQPQLQR